MDKKAFADNMRELAANDTIRSKAARMREVIDEIEAALAAGVPRSLVIKELSKQGLEMTPATFETTLKRIRQKRVKSFPTLIEHQREVSKDTPRENEENEHSNGISSDPAELDKIFKQNHNIAELAREYRLSQKSQKEKK